jgi:peptide/nickel transport system substrate-binding protein
MTTLRTITSLFLSLLLAMQWGCTPKPQKHSNNELKIGLSQEFETLNPILMTMLTTTYLSGLVIRPLAVMDADGKWVPMLAKSIPSFENGAQIITEKGTKKVKVAWEIKDNANWGDGSPVTCEDFVLSRSIALNPIISIAEKGNYSDIERIEIDGANPKKCFFVYKTVKWNFHQIGTMFPIAKHLEQSVYQQWKDEPQGYEKNTTYLKTPKNPGLYNGPFLVSELKLGSHLILEPNPHFYGVKPSLKKLIVKIIPNSSTMEANLRTQQIDMISTMGVSLDEALSFEKKIKAENLPFTVHFTPSQTFEHIDVNLEHPILKDQRVRQALLFATNRPELTTTLFEGRQTPARHFLATMDPWYTTDGQFALDYPYSKEEAAKLLDAAGWKMASDGIRKRDGQPLQISIMTTAENKTRTLVEQYLQEQWKQVGVDLQIKNEPARLFFSESVRKRKFPALAMYALVSSSENIPLSTFSSKSIPSEQNGWSGQNTYGWKNSRVDKAIEDLKGELSNNKRLDLIHGIVKEYTTELPSLPLFYRSDVAVTPKNLKGYRLTGHQFVETYQAENWTFDKTKTE